MIRLHSYKVQMSYIPRDQDREGALTGGGLSVYIPTFSDLPPHQLCGHEHLLLIWKQVRTSIELFSSDSPSSEQQK